eukprot:symbB.v1.2.034818.t1/scaffold4566.1/size37903/1
MTLAAHFYWCWGLFELVVRRRSLLQRLLAVSFLWLLFVPIPFAQMYLGSLELCSAVATALLGDVLGVAFFFSLRCTPSWRLIQAMHLEKGGFVHENLTTFWGGCSWCRSHDPPPPGGMDESPGNLGEEVGKLPQVLEAGSGPF